MAPYPSHTPTTTSPCLPGPIDPLIRYSQSPLLGRPPPQLCVRDGMWSSAPLRITIPVIYCYNPASHFWGGWLERYGIGGGRGWSLLLVWPPTTTTKRFVFQRKDSFSWRRAWIWEMWWNSQELSLSFPLDTTEIIFLFLIDTSSPGKQMSILPSPFTQEISASAHHFCFKMKGGGGGVEGRYPIIYRHPWHKDRSGGVCVCGQRSISW